MTRCKGREEPTKRFYCGPLQALRSSGLVVISLVVLFSASRTSAFQPHRAIVFIDTSFVFHQYYNTNYPDISVPKHQFHSPRGIALSAAPQMARC
ncbi:hypothetical protein ACQKWADRAFT_299368 [Trichoderma austrokoningii]